MKILVCVMGLVVLLSLVEIKDLQKENENLQKQNWEKTERVVSLIEKLEKNTIEKGEK